MGWHLTFSQTRAWSFIQFSSLYAIIIFSFETASLSAIMLDFFIVKLKQKPFVR